MAFWDFFKTSSDEKGQDYKHGLYQKAKELFPDSEENELIKWTCISGLLARVAYSDLNIDANEAAFIKKALNEISDFGQAKSDALAELAIKEVKLLAGQENHRYCYELNESIDMDNDEKYKILKLLFAVAAADGEVESVESEEIRHITKALLLEHKHYISAQATVREKLKALK